MDTDIRQLQAWVLSTWKTGSELKPFIEFAEKAPSSQAIKAHSSFRTYCSMCVYEPSFWPECDPLQSKDISYLQSFLPPIPHPSIAQGPGMSSCVNLQSCLSFEENQRRLALANETRLTLANAMQAEVTHHKLLEWTLRVNTHFAIFSFFPLPLGPLISWDGHSMSLDPRGRRQGAELPEDLPQTSHIHKKLTFA